MVAGSLDDRQALDRALEGCDTVVHLAYSEPSHTRNLLQVSMRRGIRRFVHVSSIAVHGPHPDQACSSESGAVIGRYPGEDYSNRKAAAEHIVQQAIKKGCPAIILRPTIVYGPYGPFVTSIVTATRALGLLVLLDEGNGICNAVYVDDVCDAIVAAIQTDRGVGEAFFVNADRAVTWREFNLTFATMVDADPPIVSLRSDDVRTYWASQQPTLRANVSAFGRLAMSPEFHRQLASVPMFGAVIRRGKEVAKHVFPPDRVAALKQLRRGSAQTGADSGAATIPYPDLGRVTRECMPIAFSNSKARDVLRWSPRFDLAAGANATRTWLEFAGLITSTRTNRPATARITGRSAPLAEV
jgi:nucleoside-diphosphate-sugar epimerase